MRKSLALTIADCSSAGAAKHAPPRRAIRRARHHDRAVPRRRRDRYAGPLSGRADAANSGQPSSSRTLRAPPADRRRPRRALARRRLHALIGTSTTHMLTGGLTAAVRSLTAQSSAHLDRQRAASDRRQEKPAGDDLKGLIAWLKANPDKASVGIAGVGATGHLAGFRSRRRPGRNSSSCLIAAMRRRCRICLAGQIDFMIGAGVELQARWSPPADVKLVRAVIAATRRRCRICSPGRSTS